LKIAIEEHFLPDQPVHIERWRSLAPMIPEPSRMKMIALLSNLGDRRLEAMDRAGIDIAILSSTGTVQGTLGAGAALRIAR